MTFLVRDSDHVAFVASDDCHVASVARLMNIKVVCKRELLRGYFYPLSRLNGGWELVRKLQKTDDGSVETLTKPRDALVVRTYWRCSPHVC